MNASIAALGEA